MTQTIPPPIRSEAGLAAMFMTMRGELLRFLAARGVGDEGDDLLQDLYEKLATRPIGPVGQPRAYLYRMLDNLLLDRRRAAARRASRERNWTEAQNGDAVDLDPGPSAERILIGRERLAAVTGALERLPERTVTILRRYRIDGIAQSRIAADIGISVSAVEKHLQRAYRAIVEADAAADAESPPPRRPSREGHPDDPG